MNEHAERWGRRLRAGLVGGLALATVIWLAKGSPAQPGALPPPAEATGDSPPAAGPRPNPVRSAVAGAVAAARDAQRRSVDDTVAARNSENAQQEDTFRKAGWTMIAVAPPDPRLVALDPALLQGRESELRVQIASTVAPPELGPRLHQIALAAREPATRVAAVEALGRIRTQEAQAELVALLPQLPPDDQARRQIVPLLRPDGLDHQLATQLAALIDGPILTPVEKKQLAFSLALVGLRDGSKLPDGAVSPAAQQLIQQMTALGQRGSGETKAQTQGGTP